MRPYLVSEGRRSRRRGAAGEPAHRGAPRRLAARRPARSIAMLESVVEQGRHRAQGARWTSTASRARPAPRRRSTRSRGATRTSGSPRSSAWSRPRIRALVILVVIDEPKTDVYGGLVAAPAFKEIATAAMPYLGALASSWRSPSLAAAPAAAGVGEGRASPPEARAARGAWSPRSEERDGPEARSECRICTGEVGREAVAKLLAAALEPRLVGQWTRGIAAPRRRNVWWKRGTRDAGAGGAANDASLKTARDCSGWQGDNDEAERAARRLSAPSRLAAAEAQGRCHRALP